MLQTLHSAPPLCCNPFWRVLWNADTSPISLYIVIVKYEYKIYLIHFIFFLLYSHLNTNALLQQITGFFFFFIFCMIIPKKGIFLLTHIYLICYRLCQQACPHSLLPVYSWCFISMYLCEHKMLFSQRQINRLVKQHVLSAFYVGCCAGATKQPFVEHSRDACQMNPICMRTWTYSGRRTAAWTMNGSDWTLWFPERL